MRYFTVPQPVSLQGIGSRNSLSLETLWVEMLLPKFAVGDLTRVRLANSLSDKLEAAKPGSLLELQDAEHEALVRALAALDAPGQLKRRLLPTMFEAVMSADTKPPESD